MAAGIKRLQRIQFGKESVAGTAVVATTRWRGAGNMLDDQRKVEEIEEMIGIIDGADRDAVVQLLGMIQLNEVPMTPEQFQYLLVMGIGGSTTGSADGGGSGKVYTTNLPTTAVPTAVPYSIEGGDNFEVEGLEYCVCTKVGISFAMGQTARMSGTLMGRQVQRLSGGFAAGATIPAVSELPAQQGKVYLDAIGGSYGGTQVSNTIIGGKIDYEFMWQPVFTMDGNLYYSYPSYVGHKVSGELTFLHDTAGAGNTGAKADFRARTPKLLRIDLIGDALTTGATYTTKKVIIDLPIKYLNPGPLADNNGNDIVVMKFHSRYNTTAGNQGKFIVVNQITPLP
jgi:hypothetical protein